MSSYEEQNFVGEWRNKQQRYRKRKPVSTISDSKRNERDINKGLYATQVASVEPTKFYRARLHVPKMKLV
jgi:hypothetical protein